MVDLCELQANPVYTDVSGEPGPHSGTLSQNKTESRVVKGSEDKLNAT